MVPTAADTVACAIHAAAAPAGDALGGSEDLERIDVIGSVSRNERGRMHRPSGTTVVTAGLGALVLFHGVWSWGTRRDEPRPQQALPASSDIVIGAAFHLHSGAWRARPAPVEEAPKTTPAPLAAPEAAAVVETPSPPVRSAPIQQITRHVEPPTPPPQAQASGQLEPPAPPVDRASAMRVPPAEGRMALAGPDTEAGHPPAGHANRPPPPMNRTAPRAPEGLPEADSAAPRESKFGPAFFGQFERHSF